eukprot:TRINITY_DN33898_c0_g1_i1.p1 TRINITY_DN33898_c0_g1~~TRINITY_DN33898_c0_g1_i1.p1  ORF type:complete len:772 (+),score=163.10 TRINITY_DN33898_c0_g1_i1:106-2421(+)
MSSTFKVPKGAMVFPTPVKVDTTLLHDKDDSAIRWKLPVTVSVELFPEELESECFLVASGNMHGWGKGGDALTAFAAVSRDDFTFRTKVFGAFPPKVQRHAKARLTLQAWNQMEMTISKTSATYSINSVKIATVTFEAGDLPSVTPLLGLYAFGHAYQARNFTVVDAKEALTWKVSFPPRLPGPRVVSVGKSKLVFPVPGQVVESAVAGRSDDGAIRWRLPARVSVEVYPTHPTTECFLIITENQRGWPGGDGITAAAGVNRYDFTFRGQVFGTFPPVRRFTDAVMLRKDNWNLMVLEVSTEKAIYYINDAPIAAVAFKEGDLPTVTPFIGLYGFKEEYQMRNFRVSPLELELPLESKRAGALDAVQVDMELTDRLGKLSSEGPCDTAVYLESLCFIRKVSDRLLSQRAELQLDSSWEIMSKGSQLVARVWQAAVDMHGMLDAEASAALQENCRQQLPSFLEALAEACAGRGVLAAKYAYHLAEDMEMGQLPCFDRLRERVIQALDLPSYWDTARMQTTPIPAGCGLCGDKHGGKNLLLKSPLSPDEIEVMQRLVDTSYKKKYTRDRRGVKVPDSLIVVDGFCVQNAVKWYEYRTCQTHILAQLEKLKHDGAATLLSIDNLKTSGVLPDESRFALDSNSNDAWLWHGTSMHAAEEITSTDFRLDKSGSHAGSLFGKGIYFAECCSKSDEYSDADEDGLHCLLLCRVTLGNVFYCEEKSPDPNALVKRCLDGRFHSVLGDREKVHGTFREFVVYHDDQCVPEYVIRYRRAYK